MKCPIRKGGGMSLVFKNVPGRICDKAAKPSMTRKSPGLIRYLRWGRGFVASDMAAYVASATP